MATEEEIVDISRLVKIRIVDHREYVEKVHDMINFFGMLDSAGVMDDDLHVRDIPLSHLREDKYVASDANLMDRLKHDNDGYVRAPGMN